jgi:outer membrane biosynthesis protein TonB
MVRLVLLVLSSWPRKPPSQPRQPPSQPRKLPSQPRKPPSQPRKPVTRPRKPVTRPRQPPSQPRQAPSQPRQAPSQPQQPVTQPRQPPSQPRKPPRVGRGEVLGHSLPATQGWNFGFVSLGFAAYGILEHQLLQTTQAWVKQGTLARAAYLKYVSMHRRPKRRLAGMAGLDLDVV